MQYDSEAVSGSKSDVPEFNKTGFDAHYEASGNNRPVVPQFIAPLLPMPEKFVFAKIFCFFYMTREDFRE